MRDRMRDLGGCHMDVRAVVASLAALTALATGIAVAGTGPAAASAKLPPAPGGTMRGGVTRRTEAAGAVLASAPDAGVPRLSCTAPAAYRAIAARLSAGIEGALRGRAGHLAVTVHDPVPASPVRPTAGGSSSRRAS